MNASDLLKFSVEAACPDNTVVYDDIGRPSIMVRIPKFRICDVIDGGSEAVHPAFIVQGKEVDELLISKYSNIIEQERAYSLPHVDPLSDIDQDTARKACENKGKGWHLMTNAEWAAIALWCKKNGTVPSGNNTFGCDVYHPHQRGVISNIYDRRGTPTPGRTYTGSGPVTFSHNHTPSGIYDLNGNVWAQVGGLRLIDGEYQIIADNDAALPYTEQQWRAILPDGTLVSPGTSGTLKVDNPGGKISIATEVTNRLGKSTDVHFADIPSAAAIPELMKTLLLYPADKDGYGSQRFWSNNTDHRIVWRGGTWDALKTGGIFCLFACYTPDYHSIWAGFRAAYMEL